MIRRLSKSRSSRLSLISTSPNTIEKPFFDLCTRYIACGVFNRLTFQMLLLGWYEELHSITQSEKGNFVCELSGIHAACLWLAILRRALKVRQHYKDQKKSDDTVFSILHLAIPPSLCIEGWPPCRSGA